jgi:hypothetical protein
MNFLGDALGTLWWTGLVGVVCFCVGAVVAYKWQENR